MKLKQKKLFKESVLVIYIYIDIVLYINIYIYNQFTKQIGYLLNRQ